MGQTLSYPLADTKACLLPQDQTSGLWAGSDTEALYRENCVRRPPGWREQGLHYSWNREGYRAPEWLRIKWSDSHVVMGCSFVLGIGVDDADTLPNQLSQLLGEPTVNLGYAGGSCQVIQYNTMRLIELGWLPKTVTIIIPELARMTYFDNSAPRNLMPLSQGPLDQASFYRYWLRSPGHAELYSRMAILGAEALWVSHHVPVVLRHWHHNPQEGSQMAPYLTPAHDLARDVRPTGTGSWYAHPGPKTLNTWACELADSIRLL
jgi:hypothetical protein